jgi:putative secretion activating protein|nr:MAG TPA: Lysozyme [Caudoviricetes sp.]
MDRFKKFLDYIFEVEGGYTDDKNDRGGKTTWGITEEEARDFGYTGDMRNLTKDFAKNIYLKKYYLGNKLDKVKNDKVALSIFDWAVNSGRRGIKKAQIVANKFGANLVIDGIVGNKTLEVINGINPEAFLKEYHEIQRIFYKNLAARDSSQEGFLKGWLNRVKIKEKFIEKEMV